jgi:hypothetical protein
VNPDDASLEFQASFDRKTAARERALPASRRSIRFSANSIRAIHRLEFDEAERLMKESRAAIDEGLAAGMFGFHDTDACRRALGIPADVTPVAAVTIGHPGGDDPGGSRRKFPWKPLEEVVRWERW